MTVWKNIQKKFPIAKSRVRYTNVSCGELTRQKARRAFPDSLVEQPKSGIIRLVITDAGARRNKTVSAAGKTESYPFGFPWSRNGVWFLSKGDLTPKEIWLGRSESFRGEVVWSSVLAHLRPPNFMGVRSELLGLKSTAPLEVKGVEIFGVYVIRIFWVFCQVFWD